MKAKLTLLTLSFLSFFSPIELSAILLMTVIFVDTIVKLISLKKIACEENKKYKDVFKSKILRRGYIFKGAGYYLLALAVFPLDYYGFTPFLQSILKATGYEIIVPTKAFFTNILLYIFAIIELSSINENWFDLTGNNIFKSVFKVVKTIRGGIEKVSDTYKNIKD
jgi:hypothetical protein